MQHKGSLLVMEGIDGAGKTEQAHRLVKTLQDEGYTARYVKAPGETPIGQAIRHIVLEQDPPLYKDLYTRQLLFLADHIELLYQVIIPALDAGEIVVCDRFLDSTFAYAVGGLKLDPNRIAAMIHTVIMHVPQHLFPVLPGAAFLLDVPVHIARQRLSSRTKSDIWDTQGTEYYQRIASEYYKLYPAETRGDCYIDASRDKDTVATLILRKALKHVRSLNLPNGISAEVAA